MKYYNSGNKTQESRIGKHRKLKSHELLNIKFGKKENEFLGCRICIGSYVRTIEASMGCRWKL